MLDYSKVMSVCELLLIVVYCFTLFRLDTKGLPWDCLKMQQPAKKSGDIEGEKLVKRPPLPLTRKKKLTKKITEVSLSIEI